MKSHCYLLYALFLLVSCKGTEEPSNFRIDLADTIPNIAYSEFVESVAFKELYITDSLPINRVERLYWDEDKIFVQGEGRDGILVFDAGDGRLLHRINAFGDGPTDLKRIGAFCLDVYHKLICIFDKGDARIKMFDYEGRYVSAYSTELFFMDMAKLTADDMTYFYPIYSGEEQYCGIWTCDTLDRLKKQVYAHVTADCKFHYFPMMYNWKGSSVYYYDRNWDELSLVTSDTLQQLYRFDLKQKIPLDQMGMKTITPNDLDGRAIMHSFASSKQFILLSFHTFHQEDMRTKDFTWLLINRETGKQLLSKHLKDDLTADSEETNHSLFYLNDQTWIRTDESADDRIRLHLLHVK